MAEARFFVGMMRGFDMVSGEFYTVERLQKVYGGFVAQWGRSAQPGDVLSYTVDGLRVQMRACTDDGDARVARREQHLNAWRTLIRDQRQWIVDRGGTVEGYVRRYGDPGIARGDGGEMYGDGGTALFEADVAALRGLWRRYLEARGQDDPPVASWTFERMMIEAV